MWCAFASMAAAVSALRDRGAGLDGTLEVQDRPGGGTRLEAVVPCG